MEQFGASSVVEVAAEGRVWPHAGPQSKIGLMKPKHVFILRRGIVASLDMDTIAATVADLKALNLYRLPYDHDVYVQLVACEYRRDLPPDDFIEFGPLGDFCNAIMVDPGTGRVVNLLDGGIGDLPIRTSKFLEQLLIVLLATKNAEKRTKENKLAKLGIGKRNPRNKFDYITSIALPKELPPDNDHPPVGGIISPHLRRGHIRRQHYGRGRQLEKQIWIAPVFVNADPAFVQARRAYKVFG